jgi:hypothetical protein
VAGQQFDCCPATEGGFGRLGGAPLDTLLNKDDFLTSKVNLKLFFGYFPPNLVNILHRLTNIVQDFSTPKSVRS